MSGNTGCRPRWAGAQRKQDVSGHARQQRVSKCDAPCKACATRELGRGSAARVSSAAREPMTSARCTAGGSTTGPQWTTRPESLRPSFWTARKGVRTAKRRRAYAHDSHVSEELEGRFLDRGWLSVGPRLRHSQCIHRADRRGHLVHGARRLAWRRHDVGGLASDLQRGRILALRSLARSGFITTSGADDRGRFRHHCTRILTRAG